jgi:hypothetical protein
VGVKICYLCGEKATTRDHVFPYSLFEKPRLQLITVPACASCNGSLSADEEYFRAFVLGASYQHPTAKALWDGPVKRSFANSPPFQRMLASQLRPFEVKSKAGLYLGKADALYAENHRINRVLEKISRGLHFHHRERARPEDVRFSFHQITAQNSDVAPMELIQSLPIHRVGDVVMYRVGVAEEDARVSMSALVLYERVFFIVGTVPADAEEPRPN